MSELGEHLVHESHPTAGNLMDSKTSHLDDLLLERLELAYHAETASVQLHEMAKIASEFSPIDLAYAAAHLPSLVRFALFENLPDWEAKIQFLVTTGRDTRVAVYRQLTDGQVRDIIQQMPVDDAVWVIDDLSGRRIRKVFELLPSELTETIRERQEHDRHSAGRMMTSEFFAFTMEMTIGEAAQNIREHPGIEFTRRIFVLDAKGQLLGYVPARNLIINRRDLPLRQVMRPIHHKVTPDASRDEVVDLVERYKVSALPVVESDGMLVGVVTYEDVVEAIEDLADETIAQMAGTLEDVSEHVPVIKRFFARAPWLVVTLCGGLINAASISYFEGVIGPWLSFTLFFVPLITGMSGNVGVQCSTVLVRAMAIGVLSAGGRGEAIAKEITTGVLTGFVFGILCGVVVFLLNHFGIQTFSSDPIGVGVIVGTGLFGACMTATLLGVFAPLFFARIGVDPAVAAGPIVTAFNDVLSMLMYFAIAQLINVTIYSSL